MNLLLFLELLLILHANGATLLVGQSQQYPTILSALLVAKNGDTITITPGTYTGINNTNLNLRGLAVVLQGQTTQSTDVVIDCQNTPGIQALLFNNQETPQTVIANLSIQRCNSTVGGAINIQNSSPTLSNLQITRCSALDGGGISVEAQSGKKASPVIQNVLLLNNTATRSGGGLYLKGSTDAVLRNVQVIGNQALSVSSGVSSNGGGLYGFNVVNLQVDRCTFQGNTADNNGGGIYLFDSEIVLGRTELSGNIALNGNGGGVYVYTSSPIISKNIIFANLTLKNNSAGGSGGGLGISNANPSMENVICQQNRASGTGGGASYAMSTISGLIPQIKNSQFLQNSAATGGGLYVEANIPPSQNSSTYAVQIELVQLVGNNAVTGAGIYFGQFSGTAPALVKDVEASRNVASGQGGGMYVSEGSPRFLNCRFTDNVATSGGGLFIETKSQSAAAIHINSTIIANNTANIGDGGGILFRNGPKDEPKIVNSTFSSNFANSTGGALHFTNLYDGRGLTLSGVTALNNSAGAAGGIYLSSTLVKISGLRAVGNVALVGNGGGLSTDRNKQALIFIEDSIFDSNVASAPQAQGGGVSCGACSGTIRNSQFLQNHASTGGGLSITTPPKLNFSITDSLIRNNLAELSGAGVSMDSLSQTSFEVLDTVFPVGHLTNVSIIGNQVFSNQDEGNLYGGGLFLKRFQIGIQDCQILQNRLQGNLECQGGGIYAESFSMGIENTDISGNEILGGNFNLFGAGLYLSDSKTVTITGSHINQNSIGFLIPTQKYSSELHGGGIYLLATSLEMVNTVVSDNALGVDGVNGSFFDNLGDLSFSAFGAGVHVTSRSALGVTNCQFQRNAVRGNSRSYGGGIFVDLNSELDLEQAVISANNCSGNGGGLAFLGATRLGMSDTSFTFNQAYQGGGLFLSENAPESTSLTFAQNFAAAFGGAIYLTQSKLSLVKSKVTNNTAKYRGGIFAKNDSLVTISTDSHVENNPPDFYDETAPMNSTATFDIGGETVNSPETITVYAKDNRGERRSQGGDTVRVKISNKDNSSVVILPNVVDKQDGTYVSEWTTTLAGRYLIDIQINGVQILGSPFDRIKSPGAVNASNSYVINPLLLNTISCCNEVSVEVQFVDDFGNNSTMKTNQLSAVRAVVRGPTSGQLEMLLTTRLALKLQMYSDDQHQFDVSINGTSLKNTPFLFQPQSVRTLFCQNSLVVIVAVIDGILGGLTILMAIGALFFSGAGVFQDARPSFLIAILIGLVLSMVSVGMNLLKPTSTTCRARNWLWGTGFILIYSALCAKKLRASGVVKWENFNYHLAACFGVFYTAEFILLIVWEGVSKPEPEEYAIQDIGMSKLRCKWSPVFVGIFYGLKFTWLIFGAALAWMSRNLKDKYRELRYIGFNIYNLIFALIILTIVLFIFPGNAETQTFLASLAILFSVLVTLLITFLPKFFRALKPKRFT